MSASPKPSDLRPVPAPPVEGVSQTEAQTLLIIAVEALDGGRTNLSYNRAQTVPDLISRGLVKEVNPEFPNLAIRYGAPYFDLTAKGKKALTDFAAATNKVATSAKPKPGPGPRKGVVAVDNSADIAVIVNRLFP